MSKATVAIWNLWINGVPLDERRRKSIDSIDIVEQCDGSDTLSVVVNDPDFLYIEDNIFIDEATISAEIYFYGDTHVVRFNGYISAIDISFPEDGIPYLSIFCLDRSHIMNRKKKKRSWDNVTRADVVRKIAAEYGLRCVVESGYDFKTEDSISQSNVTDIAFCENLASEEIEPFMCKLVEDTLYYVRKGILDTPSCTLRYRKFPYDVISFSPKINKETKSIEVNSSDINTSDGSVSSSTANQDNSSGSTQGTPTNSGSAPQYRYNPATQKWEVI